MTWSARPPVLRAYVVVVATVGLVLVAALARTGGWRTAVEAPAAYWLLAGLLVASELVPVAVPGRGGSHLVTISVIFGFAVLLGWGTAAAVLTYAAGAALAETVRRRPPEVVVFNAAQYGLAIGVAGAVYGLLGGTVPFTPDRLPAFGAAALVFLVANNALERVAVALDRRTSLLDDLREDAGAETWLSLIMFTMAPVAFLMMTTSTALLVLLVPPLLGVHVICRTAMSAQAARADAEQATEHARALAAERGRLVEAEHELIHQLQESDRLKADLLATVSHELRTPLTAVLSALTLLQVRGGDLDPDRRRMLVGLARDSGERLGDLIEQLLLAAHFEEIARNPVGHRPIDVAALTRMAAVDWRGRCADRRIEVAGDSPLRVRVTPEVLGQVTANLLDNAVKHAPGSPIRVEVARHGDKALLAVTDHGPGIAPDDRERIFEPFTQVDSGSTRRVGGMGLGLYIGRQLARAYGGELLVREPRDAATGARFELHLPLAREDGVPLRHDHDHRRHA